MRILRAFDRTAAPWKNGGGVTYEVCAAPMSAGFKFDWRLSVANVEKSGSFSRFPHTDRKLAVVKGRMRLNFNNCSADIMPQSQPISFDGDAETFAEVMETVIDVNLMTRRGQYCGTLEWILIKEEITICENESEIVVVAVDPIVTPACQLACLDAVWCDSGSKLSIIPQLKKAHVLKAKIWRVASHDKASFNCTGD